MCTRDMLLLHQEIYQLVHPLGLNVVMQLKRAKNASLVFDGIGRHQNVHFTHHIHVYWRMLAYLSEAPVVYISRMILKVKLVGWGSYITDQQFS